MRLGVLSDIHGNRVALDAVLDDMPPVDGLLCAGDVVGYNPWHADCVAAVRDRDVPCVKGNHDRAVATGTAFRFNSMAGAGIEHARETLSDDQIEWLAGLPDERVECDGRVKIVHGHPDDPDRYTYPDQFSPRLLDEEDVLIMGHTHVQGHEQYEEGIVMNPGSVGQPRDGDPRAAYAVLDLNALTVEEHRVEYDIGAVRRAVEEAGLPAKIGSRLEKGR
ncbi:metallophosphoesterase family protein [Halostella sp. JP-L12]|uniref:metallophosphoesterase family protein n=1 Tax=Halostella TaxID=1843185 RepID=UPI000EF7D502|nr:MULTISPECIES: metallophosphoesterase family protein [Halostella]NHN46177.1 metallophosphoesterase family protein [Halostella sp. JP-L12]